MKLPKFKIYTTEDFGGSYLARHKGSDLFIIITPYEVGIYNSIDLSPVLMVDNAVFVEDVSMDTIFYMFRDITMKMNSKKVNSSLHYNRKNTIVQFASPTTGIVNCDEQTEIIEKIGFLINCVTN